MDNIKNKCLYEEFELILKELERRYKDEVIPIQGVYCVISDFRQGIDDFIDKLARGL